jgi:hypothetical protein
MHAETPAGATPKPQTTNANDRPFAYDYCLVLDRGRRDHEVFVSKRVADAMADPSNIRYVFTPMSISNTTNKSFESSFDVEHASRDLEKGGGGGGRGANKRKLSVAQRKKEEVRQKKKKHQHHKHGKTKKKATSGSTMRAVYARVGSATALVTVSFVFSALCAHKALDQMQQCSTLTVHEHL